MLKRFHHEVNLPPLCAQRRSWPNVAIPFQPQGKSGWLRRKAMHEAMALLSVMHCNEAPLGKLNGFSLG